MKTKDIMTQEVISVSPKTKVTEIAKMIHEHNFNGLPVLDENRKVLGLVTETDLLSNDSFGIHIPSFVKIISDFNVLKAVKGEDREDIKSIVNANAESIMRPDFAHVSPEATLTELLALFNEKKANPIVVADDDKIIQGIVARSDVIKLVSQFSEAELDFLRE